MSWWNIGIKSEHQQGLRYLKNLGIGHQLQRAGTLLFKPLSMDLVHEGPKRLSSISTPGLNCFFANILKRLCNVIEPKMY